jgi:pyruvate dehydrogenase E1 component beta subunit
VSARTLSYRQAINEALVREMDRDESVFVFGLDVDDPKQIYGTTRGLVDRFGARRCFGTPLSEEAMTGMALGAALCGLRPVHVHVRVDFLLLAMNQLANMVSLARYMSAGELCAPLVIRAVVGRGWGQGAQRSKSMQSVFAHIPGLKVVMPASPNDAFGLLTAAIRDDNPVLVLEHRWLYDIEGPVEDLPDGLPIGPAARIREGHDVTVVATSWMTVEALMAAEILAARGVELEILNARTIAPLDDTLILDSCRRTGRCIVADNDWPYCGFGAELSARIHERCFGALRVPVSRIGWAQSPCPTTRTLEDAFYPNALHIIRAAEAQLELAPMDLSGTDFYAGERRFKGPF